MDKHRMAVCSRCGREWHISKYTQIPFYGYICPICRQKDRQRRGAVARKAVLGVGILILTVELYLLARYRANAWRGYQAVGGEALILGLPLYIYAIGRTVQDWRIRFREILKEGRL
ncbi:MAG: hypothetical protein VB078_07020 [Clostridiaceae bacterium]|nr:hypothetical protein [Clostridiaceae bacterium]